MRSIAALLAVALALGSTAASELIAATSALGLPIPGGHDQRAEFGEGGVQPRRVNA